MADYTGQSCFCCQKPFQPEDDVVVCPDCGTPYHRECYQHFGHCINRTLHEMGGSWKPVDIPNPEPSADATSTDGAMRRCPRCGKENPAQQAFCGHCGMILNESQNDNGSATAWQQNLRADADLCCGLDPNEDYEGVRLEDLANFVRTNTIYYIPAFKKFRETTSKFTMNLISALLPHFYFACRKMWGMTFLVIGAFLLLNLPSELYSLVTNNDSMISSLQAMQGQMGAMYDSFLSQMIQDLQTFCETLLPYETILHRLHLICLYLNFALRVCLFAFSNYFYYQFALRKVRKIRAEELPEEMTKTKLRTAGGTNYWYVLLSVLLQYGVSVFVTAMFLLGIMAL